MITFQPLIDFDSQISKVAEIDRSAFNRLCSKMEFDITLTRQLVSYQSSKSHAIFRWFRYKEAFSPTLVSHLLGRYGVNGPILDPFAGSGATLFAASKMAIPSLGIELLPIGCTIIRSRLRIENEVSVDDAATIRRWIEDRPWTTSVKRAELKVLAITRGAYPRDTEAKIEKYLGECEAEREVAGDLLRFALLCILECVSYTRKDGQYLRWDYRSGRRVGAKPFDKGQISTFDDAISKKLTEILIDLNEPDGAANLFSRNCGLRENIQLLEGSCLRHLPLQPSNSFAAVFTSPPYCNRYDYTRTYALELALLGASESDVKYLRQQMLSCTVENRAKDLLGINALWDKAVSACDHNDLLQAVLAYLDVARAESKLNNNGIARMVRGYFNEMACVIYECHRTLIPGGLMFMVNDNVRYAGAAISVDLILSEIAEMLGFDIERILVLPNGKGNSSQQMGKHGRESLRKCVYVWRKR